MKTFKKKLPLFLSIILMLINMSSFVLRYQITSPFSCINYVLFFLTYILITTLILLFVLIFKSYTTYSFFTVLTIALVLRFIYLPVIGFYGTDSWHEMGNLLLLDKSKHLPQYQYDLYPHLWLTLMNSYPVFYLNVYVWNVVSGLELQNIASLGIKFLTIVIEIVIYIIALRATRSKVSALCITLMYAVFRVHYIAHGIVHREAIGMPLLLLLLLVYAIILLERRNSIRPADTLIITILTVSLAFTHHFSAFVSLLLALSLLATIKHNKKMMPLLLYVAILPILIHWIYHRKTPIDFLSKIVDLLWHEEIYYKQSPVEAVISFTKDPKLALTLYGEIIYAIIIILMTLKSYLDIKHNKKSLSENEKSFIESVFATSMSLIIVGISYVATYPALATLGSVYTIAQKIQTFLYVLSFLIIAFHLRHFQTEKSTHKCILVVLFISGFALTNFLAVPGALFNVNELGFKGIARSEEIYSSQWLEKYTIESNYCILVDKWMYSILASMAYTKNIVTTSDLCSIPSMCIRSNSVFVYTKDCVKYGCIELACVSDLKLGNSVYRDGVVEIYFYSLIAG